jgi:hypothetical protein
LVVAIAIQVLNAGRSEKCVWEGSGCSEVAEGPAALEKAVRICGLAGSGTKRGNGRHVWIGTIQGADRQGAEEALVESGEFCAINFPAVGSKLLVSRRRPGLVKLRVHRAAGPRDMHVCAVGLHVLRILKNDAVAYVHVAAVRSRRGKLRARKRRRFAVWNVRHGRHVRLVLIDGSDSVGRAYIVQHAGTQYSFKERFGHQNIHLVPPVQSAGTSVVKAPLRHSTWGGPMA